MPTLNILFPVFNEEKRLRRGIERTNRYLAQKGGIDYLLTIVDNASTDGTGEIAQALCAKYPQHVRYIRIAQKGVGAAFRAGVKENKSDIVGYMDVDLSTNIRHLDQMYDIFCTDSAAAIVNASRWSRQAKNIGRKWYRNLTSIGLVYVLKLVFGMKATDAICGFKFFRKDALEKLMAETDDSTDNWFYIIELLLRAERKGLKIVELPVIWVDDKENSTVHAGSLVWEYLRQIAALKRRFREKNKGMVAGKENSGCSG